MPGWLMLLWHQGIGKSPENSLKVEKVLSALVLFVMWVLQKIVCVNHISKITSPEQGVAGAFQQHMSPSCHHPSSRGSHTAHGGTLPCCWPCRRPWPQPQVRLPTPLLPAMGFFPLHQDCSDSHSSQDERHWEVDLWRTQELCHPLALPYAHVSHSWALAMCSQPVFPGQLIACLCPMVWTTALGHSMCFVLGLPLCSSWM